MERFKKLIKYIEIDLSKKIEDIESEDSYEAMEIYSNTTIEVFKNYKKIMSIGKELEIDYEEFSDLYNKVLKEIRNEIKE